jgi:Putative adhesin
MTATPFEPQATPEVEDASARTYAVDPGSPLTLNVANDAGNVVVRTVDRATLLVGSSGDPDAAGDDDAPPDLRVVANGNDVTVAPLGPHAAIHPALGDRFAAGDRSRGARHRGWLPFARWWMGRTVDIRIEIPTRIPSVNLTVVTASGEIDIAGVRGAVSVRTASGDIMVMDAQADLRIDAASGDIRLGSVRGALQAQTASGDLVAQAARLDRLAFRSASGDLNLRGVTLARGEHQIDTASGDIDLTLETEEADGAPIGVAMTTMSGEARIGPGVIRLRGKDNAATNGVGTIIRVRTMSGDFAARAVALSATAGDRVAAAGDRVMAEGDRVMAAAERMSQPSAPDVVQPAAPEPPAPVSGRDAERLAILRSLEKGDISIEEATLRLDAVDAPLSSGG